jgi:rsbT co-antagonist protein RsbR
MSRRSAASRASGCGLQQEVIRAQESALQELSTPIVPIADGALAVPLIGSLDRARMQQIVSTLLQRISDSNATIVILDLTGVRQVETATMDALLHATQAIRLLGVEAVLTGIQPDMAQTIVGLDIPLQQVTTLQTLQRGIEYALAKLRRARPGRQARPGR